MRTIVYAVDETLDGKKIRNLLRQAGYGARFTASLKRRENGILLNGVHARTVDVMRAGDTVTVNIDDDAQTVEPIEYPLDIIYEDEDVLVINKPAGLAMHPTHNHQGDTLANAVSAYLLGSGKSLSFRAVGRLDKGTSGVVVCALNRLSAGALNGNIKKTYVALASGDLPDSGVIDKKIYRPDPGKTLRAAGDTGDDALTRYEVLSRFDGFCAVKVNIETGRTHQIRVHFSSEGHPLLGDDMYGGDTTLLKRPALHCAEAELVHPVTGEKMTFSAPLPDDMRKLTGEIVSG